MSNEELIGTVQDTKKYKLFIELKVNTKNREYKQCEQKAIEYTSNNEVKFTG